MYVVGFNENSDEIIHFFQGLARGIIDFMCNVKLVGPFNNVNKKKCDGEKG